MKDVWVWDVCMQWPWVGSTKFQCAAGQVWCELRVLLGHLRPICVLLVDAHAIESGISKRYPWQVFRDLQTLPRMYEQYASTSEKNMNRYQDNTFGIHSTSCIQCQILKITQILDMVQTFISHSLISHSTSRPSLTKYQIISFIMIFDRALCRPEHKSKVGESLNRSGTGQFEVVKLHLETLCVQDEDDHRWCHKMGSVFVISLSIKYGTLQI